MEFLAGLTLGVKDKPTELIFKFLTSEKDEFNYYDKLLRLGLYDKFVFIEQKKMTKELIF